MNKIILADFRRKSTDEMLFGQFDIEYNSVINMLMINKTPGKSWNFEYTLCLMGEYYNKMTNAYFPNFLKILLEEEKYMTFGCNIYNKYRFIPMHLLIILNLYI